MQQDSLLKIVLDSIIKKYDIFKASRQLYKNLLKNVIIMKKEEIAILREKVKKYLETYCNHEKVIIPKELLEGLLFEVVEVNIKGKWYKVKVPIWSGDFISKIDLKEITFQDVLWNYDICMALNSVFDQLIEIICQIKSTNQAYTNIPYEINYANTNAQIDLSESFLFNFGKSSGIQKYNGLISVARCNFSGTDVKIGEGVKAIQFSYSNFSKSGISIPNIESIHLNDTDLSDNDLSNLYINGLSYHFSGTNFRNSGINISIDISKLESYIKMDDKYFKKLFLTMLNDYFVGCNVNGNYLNSHKEEDYNLKLILKRK